MSLKNHVKRMQFGLARSKEIYEMLGQKFSANPNVQLWRLRYRAIYLFSMAGLWLSKGPKDFHSTAEYGETIQTWRNSSKVGSIVTRNIIARLCQKSTFTLAELEVLCGPGAGRTAIQGILKTGVDLGLLIKNKGDYSATDLLLREAYDRTLVKLLDPEIVEFAEFVIMFNTLRKNASVVSDLEQRGDLGLDEGLRQSIPEALYNGMYDDEIYLPGQSRADLKVVAARPKGGRGAT